MYDECVRTYADSFGIWHARVIFPEPGYEPAYLAAHNKRIRAKARRAIRREVAQRQGEMKFTVRIHVKATDLDSFTGSARSILYAER